MASSFVRYNHNGFWSWDGYLEHFLFMMAEAIGPSSSEPWLNEVLDHWKVQATGVFLGWVHPMLDEFVNSEARRQLVLKLIENVVNAKDVTTEVVQTAEFTRRLLLGELTTIESSPLNYMVHGEHPYEWCNRRDAEK